jgi:hypothetical protein
MRRFLSTMLFASILFVLQARAPIFAQEAGQQKPAAPLWQPLSEGVWKTDLGDERPEVVIVKMSNDEFDKLRKHKRAWMDYIDNHHYLKKKLIDIVFIDVVYAKNGPGHGWWVCIPHSTHSTAGILAWQVPEENTDKP